MIGILALLFVLCIVGTIAGAAAEPLLDRSAASASTKAFEVFIWATTWPIALAIAAGELIADVINDGLDP